MGQFDNKVALITGGSSGIGRATAIEFARQGAAVALSDVNVEGGEETAQTIIDAGGKAIFIKCDVSRGDEVAAMVKTTVDTFGRLDCAVNNAGISGKIQERVHDYAEDVFDQIISINLKGVWLCMKYELPYMLEQKSGSIVNIASVAGLVGMPKGAAYTASKHGVIGLTKSAAIDYAKLGIRINAISPAFTETPMVTDMIEDNPVMKRLTLMPIPMKRLAQPEEIVAGIIWLASDASSFVTGHALTMDGGLTAS